MKTQLFILLVFIFSSMNAIAQSTDTIYLWPDKVPDELAPKNAAIQTDNIKGNVIRLTDITDPMMVVYKPSEKNNNGSSIIVCPGGGYSILAVDKEGYEVAEWLSNLGYTAYVLQYRVPQKRAGALQDIQRAIRLVRQTNAIQTDQSTQIGLLGFSAGGHLCALASANNSPSTYEPIDKADQLSTQPDFTILIYPAYLDTGDQKTISPELNVSRDVPPTFIFATADDKHANGSIVLAQELRDHQVPVEYHLLPNGGHGYGMRTGNIAAEKWPALVENWLMTQIEK